MSPDGKATTATRREQQVMLLIAKGLQNKNIAHELKLSENTVRAHIQNILRKYKLHNRTQIAIMFALGTPGPSAALAASLPSRSGQRADMGTDRRRGKGGDLPVQDRRALAWETAG